MPCLLCGATECLGKFCRHCSADVLVAAHLSGVEPYKVDAKFIGRKPEKPVPFAPGSAQKILAMRARAERLESLFHEDDGKERPNDSIQT